MNLSNNKLFLLGMEHIMSPKIFAVLEKKKEVKISTDVLLFTASNARLEELKNKFTVR